MCFWATHVNGPVHFMCFWANMSFRFTYESEGKKQGVEEEFLFLLNISYGPEFQTKGPGPLI